MGITIVGLGPGGGSSLTRAAWDTLVTSSRVYLRTKRHPAVADLPPSVDLVSFDTYYETADSFEEVYQKIVSELLQLGKKGDVVYAVPGHPNIGESTVNKLKHLADEAGITVKIVPGISFVEPVLSAVNRDGLDGLQLFDAIEIAEYAHPPLNPDFPVLLGQVYSRSLASELKLTLMAIYPAEHQVHLVHAAGTDEELVEIIPLFEVDRSGSIDHLTTLFVPALPYKASLETLAETVAILRSPEGCPWDQEQTPQSMRSGLLEEASEVLDAIDANDSIGLREELGDLLYHIVMQVQMAQESEEFTLADVISGIEAKLKRRHPHVWGDWEAADTAEVLKNWEALKKEEKSVTDASVLDNIPSALPALARSQKIQDNVRRVGFDWPDVSGVYAKLEEELAELKTAATPEEQLAELGDVFFVIVNLAAWLGLDAESSLREANGRFGRRFRRMEELMKERSITWDELNLAEMDTLWEEVKGLLARAE